MQIDSITSIANTTTLTGTLAATAQVTSDGKARNAVVERIASGYEAYLPEQIGPVATGSTVDIAESRLDSTVQFQA